MGKIKRFGIILLVAVMCSTALQAISTYKVDAATKKSGATIVVNTSKLRIAECVEGQYVFRAEYNKDTEMMSISQVGLLTKEICAVTWINLSKSTMTPTAEVTLQTNRLASAVYSQSIYENTFSDYEYTKWYGSTNKWELRSPAAKGMGTQSFRAYQTTKNSKYISGFYNSVNTINQKELTLIGLVGITALTGIVGAICTGGLAACLTAAGFTATATAEAASLQVAIKNAKDYYWDAYYSSVRI